MAGLLCDALKHQIGARKIVLAHIGECRLHDIGQFRHLVRRQYSRVEVFLAGSGLLAHQRIGVGNADLRAMEVRIDPQRQAVMLQRFIVAACHAQDFGIGILGIRLMG